MKQQTKSPRKFSRKFSLAQSLVLGVGVSVSPFLHLAKGDDGWLGTTNSDWNTGSNWTGGVLPSNGDNIYIQNTNGPATISSNSLFSPAEIRIGDYMATGRLDHTAGSLTTTASLIVGRNNGGVGTYNLANTATTGGTLTGYGMGSGSISIGGNLNVAAWQGATGTVNVNTSGTMTVSNDITVGGEGGSTGTLNLDSGTLVGNGQMRLGDDNNNGGGTGYYNQAGGSATISGLIIAGDDANTHGTLNLSGGTLTGNSEVWFGNAGTGVGNQTGGTFNANSYIVMGRAGGANATYNLSGGTLNAAVNSGLVTIGSVLGSTATMNVSGTGILHSYHQIFIGEGWTGSGTVTAALNVSGGGLVQTDDTGQGLELGVDSGANGTVNLNGGTILAPIVTQGNGTGTFNFNGGTLKAGQSTTSYMQGLTAVNVRDGGAVIDTNGYNITIAQVLQHSAISGDNATDGGLTKNGSGTLTLTSPETFTGAVTVNTGTLYANAPFSANAGTFSTASSITVNSGATLQTQVNSLFGYDGTTIKPITINSGTLNDVYGDVALGMVTLNGGTISTSTASSGDYSYGSFRFEGGTALNVTNNSTISASYVKFAGGAPINVSSGKTLSITGTVTDDNGGASSIVKSGNGTVVFSNTGNNYTGTTQVNAGSLLVNGSIGTAGSAGEVTVSNSGSLLGGTGTVNGAVTVGSSAVLQGGAGAASGALTLASTLTLNSGSNLAVTLGAAGAHSTISYAMGGFNGFNTDQMWTLGGTQAGSYDNIFTGVASGINTAGWTVTNSSGFTYSFTDDGSNIDLTVTAVPEPATVFGGLLLLGLVGYRERRRLSAFARAI